MTQVLLEGVIAPADQRAKNIAVMAERNAAFARALNAVEKEQAAMKRAREREEAEQEKLESSELAKKRDIAELQALIGRLRAKVISSGGEDKSAAAQLSAAQTELFWMTFSF